jgi:ABC-2 type transport system permease protein
MPPLVQVLARYLPFQLFKYFPIQLILGRLSPSEILFSYGMGLVWFGIALFLFRWAWSNGVKQFSAVGA